MKENDVFFKNIPNIVLSDYNYLKYILSFNVNTKKNGDSLSDIFIFMK